MNITITAGERKITATLQDCAASRDFISQLPLTLTLEDYGEAEKISFLPKKLSTAGAPAMGVPFRGAVAYYAPWGNLCMFRDGFRPSSGLVILGALDGNGIKVLDVSGKIRVTMEVKRER